MRFKLALILFSVGLLACEQQDGGDPFLQDPPSTIEEITQLALNTNYVINLPDSEPIRFNPALGRTEIQSFNFVSSGETSFVSYDDLVVRGFRSDGFLEIENRVVQFPVVFCITVPELEELYGFDFSPFFDDVKYFFGFSSPDLTLDEYLTQFVEVDHVIVAPVSTRSNDVITFSFSYFTDNRTISLGGTNGLSADQNTLTSEGEAEEFIFEDGFRIVPIGNYTTRLTCSN